MIKRLILIFLILLFPATLRATTYYVNQATGGGATCTQIAPCNSITTAYGLTSTGDTVEVAAGTYTVASPILLNRNNVTLHSTVKNGAIIDGQNSAYSIFRVSASNNVIDGFKIWRGYYFGVEMNGSGNTVQNCEIANTGNTTPSGDNQGHAGIFSISTTSNNTYRYNYIHHNGRTVGLLYSESDHGLYISGSNENVVANVITHNSGGGAQLAGYTIWSGRVYNNTFAYNRHGIWLWQTFGTSEIKNNIFYFNTGDGISSYGAHGGTIAFDANLAFGNGGTAFNYTGDGSNYAYTVGTTYTTNPLFTNPASEVYTLQRSPVVSPAIDNGVSLAAAYNTDFIGNTRGAGGAWDIGAYESITAGGPVVQIQSPVSCTASSTFANCTYTTVANASTVTLSGTSSQTTGNVVWACDRCVATNGTMTGVGTWSSGTIQLKSGINKITVTGTDTAVNIGTAQIEVTYQPSFPGNALEVALGFEETSGAALDSSDNVPPNNGSLINVATRTTNGHSGRGLTLNGTTQYVSVADANSLDYTQSFTMSIWLKPTAIHNDFRVAMVKNYMIALYASNDGTYCSSTGPVIWFNTNGISGPSYFACYATPLPTSTWTHLAATYNGTTLTLYENGVVSGTPTPAGGYIEPSANPLTIGASLISGVANEFFEGEIDEARSYNWAIPASNAGNSIGAACNQTASVATPSIAGDMNCPVVALAPPITFKLGASSSLKLGATGGNLGIGQVPP